MVGAERVYLEMLSPFGEFLKFNDLKRVKAEISWAFTNLQQDLESPCLDLPKLTERSKDDLTRYIADLSEWVFFMESIIPAPGIVLFYKRRIPGPFDEEVRIGIQRGYAVLFRNCSLFTEFGG